MNEQDTRTTQSLPHYPSNWRIAADYDPNAHLMNLKGRDYMNVQNRLLWFIRDQRDFIAKGLATTSYVIRTELVEQDRDAGFAHFKTYVRDVIGNEATMYGSEAAKDFPDYAEKASTKSLGRALLALGYGTAFAPEMDEGERVVDTPVERRRTAPAARSSAMATQTAPATPAPAAPTAPVAKATPARGSDEPVASEQQLVSIRKLCVALGKPEPNASLTYAEARQLISQLSTEYQRSRRAS
ncbi:MAG TPA: hypothetical protein VFN11_12020 [Ktedonobacterales bacterium]|nr:hypothetical protein [Ktedonobacterales bacterium]